MMWCFNMAIMSLIMLMVFSNNAVKMSISILMLSGLMFSLMSFQSGSSWLPLIFFLLFMGGILVVFMIVSSLMPNSSAKKMKASLAVLTILSLTMFSQQEKEQTQMYSSLKWSLNSKTFLITMTILMALYFLCFISVLAKNSNPMRSYTC